MAEDKWNVKGLRGSVLEELINYTNEKYRQQKLALVQKIPTSIKPVRFDKTKRHITLAYFDQKSTVDYIGVVQGIPICFDAKECAKDVFPLQNIHEHQVEFMRQYEEQGGISFLLIYFTSRHVCYYMSFQEMMKYWNRAKEGGVKHFKYEELDIGFFVPLGALIPFVFKLSPLKIILGIMFFSIAIEVLQMFSGRFFEINDILANTLGGVIGYGVYAIVNKKQGKAFN